MSIELQGNPYGNVEVVFSKQALATFILMLNKANMNTDGDYLHFSVEEYYPGRAQLLVTASSTPNSDEEEADADSIVTSIQESEG